MANETPQLRIHPAPASEQSPVGISAIGTYQPSRVVANEWFEEWMSRKFVKHTGITQRSISDVDEIELGWRSVENLLSQLMPVSRHRALSRCAALVLVCPSLIPQSIARRMLSEEEARAEQPNRAAMRMAHTIQEMDSSFSPRRVVGMNGFCSGYAKALAHVQDRLLPNLEMEAEEYVLVITANQISRITDFGCRQSGALFGDFATATLLSRVDSARFPVQFELLDAAYEKASVSRAYFDFKSCEALYPVGSENARCHEQRVVFTLDGMGIADTAPRAMAGAAANMIRANYLEPAEVDHIVPHQAGQGIVRLTSMKLEEAGFQAEVVNGLTAETGNISSGSVPFALKQNWHQLHGNILCPVAAVGAPGKPEVSQGCILLRSHRMQQARAVA